MSIKEALLQLHQLHLVSRHEPSLLPTPQTVIDGLSTNILQAKAGRAFDLDFIQDPFGILAFSRLCYLWREYVRQKVTPPSPCHQFVRHLRHQQKLLCCFTQNFDHLEGEAEEHIPDREEPDVVVKDVVRLHGDLSLLRCSHCGDMSEWKDEQSACLVAEGTVPCAACEEDGNKRKEAGKRKSKCGRSRPNIVMNGEQGQGFEAGFALDVVLESQPQLLLVMGTSAMNHGSRSLITKLAASVHNEPGGLVVFINQSPPTHPNRDVTIDLHVSMSCDHFVEDLQTRVLRLQTKQVRLSLARSL